MKQPLGERLAGLSPEQRALVELRLRKKAAQSSGPSIPAREQRDHLPLSLDQERLWFVQQLDPSSAAYNIYTAVRFKGKLQIVELTRSLNEIVRRHEIMRTCFAAPDGRPEQVIAPSLTVAIPLIDLRLLPLEFREREAARLAASNVQRSFDLAKLPLFRTVLLQVGDEEFVCPTVFHHIITDWVSFYAFDRELATLYGAFREGQPSPLEALPIQYADFAVWQRDSLTDEVLDHQIEYWRRRLEGAPPLIELPYDRVRPPVQTPSGFRQPLVLSAEHTVFIRAIARRHQLTPFIALLAIFKILLFRLTGQPQIVVGSPIANRNRPELENLLGFFINHLVFCTDTGGDPLFDDFLLRVKETALGAYANQDVPFAKVVEAVRPDRDLSRTPLTQVVFLFLNPEQQGEIHLSGQRILPYMIDSESSKFDMTFSLWEGDSGYSGWIEYNPDLFDRTTILRMGEQFRSVVTSLAADPGQRISSLPILHAAARHQLLVEWNDSALPLEPPSIVQRIEEQARLRPDADAVSDDRGRLTFEQLNAAANRLARRLAKLGIGLESRVGVLLPRSVEMVVAWLAVVKAGGAYVPLADDTPRARWHGMLEDAGARVLISDRTLAAGYEGPVVWIDEPDTVEPAANLDVAIQPQSLVYVIFTSGSTGRPKGVAIEHRGLSNLARWHEEAHHVKPGDRATQVASAGFDAAGWEIWPYLCAGASVAILGGDQRLSPAAIVQYLDAARVTHCFLPTPLAEAVLEEDWRAEYLRVLLTGGDRLRKRPGHLAGKLWNHYGPTEVTVAATAGPVEESGDDLPDIGRPIGNTRAYVLDPHGNPVAVGVAGELYLGGHGVARGYVGRAAETAERFVPDAFSAEPGQRLYRTGDLVRWGRNGRLHFLGRADDQVKLRGYRIELGEIEAQLTALPGVRAAAALVNGNGARRQICAYVSGDGLQPERLRIALRERLPEYMEPSSIRLLDDLPLTSNGKVDRAALARLEDVPQVSSSSVAPRNQAEETLAAIWREALGLAHVGVFDNFFQVGGDSILSMRVVSRARAAGLLLTPRQIFEHQTIAGLAAAAGRNPEVSADHELVAGPGALAPMQKWFFAQDPVDAHHFNQALMLRMDLRPSPAMLRCAVRGIAAHHDALRSQFHAAGAGWSVEFGGPGEVPLVWLDLRDVAVAFRTSIIEASAAALQRSLDLGNGPLFRFAFFDCGDPLASRLLLIVHHLVIDGVSWRILLEDLETSLGQLSRGQPVCLPAKTVSYRQWAEQMSDRPVWQTAAGREENTVASCASIDISLDAAQTRVLIEQSGPAFRAQIQDLLLTACSDALADCGFANCAVDFEGHGRDLPGSDLNVSRTVGWFTVVHTLPPPSKNLAPLERLKHVKTQVRTIADGQSAGPAGGADLLFNYLGRLDLAVHAGSPVQPAPECVGPVRGPFARRNYLFEVDAGIVGGCLAARWVYSRNIHRDEDAQQLAAAFERSLLRLLAGRAPGDSYVPQDFLLAEVSQAQLDSLVVRYGAFEDAYALSPVQEGMLIHVLSSGNPGAFHERLTCTLLGPLDAELFRESWQRVLERHPALRTCFSWSEFEKPVQIVMPKGRVNLDLSICEGPSPTEEEPFDLTQAPLLRLALTRTGDHVWEFAWTCHHLILDGWSLPLILREVMDAYAAPPGQAPVSPTPARPYADFVGWLKRQDPRRAEEFWRRTLRGFRAPTPIGGDTIPFDGRDREEYGMDLPESLAGALRSLGRDCRLTLNTLFQGAWALLLGRASGQDDVVFGVTASGRPADLPDAGSIVGMFANTQPLRVRIPTDATLIDWLQQLQTQQAEAREFEYTALAQQCSEVPLGLPLFESLLVFENYPVDPGAPLRAGGVEVVNPSMPVQSMFPLTLVVLPGEVMRLYLSYDRRRFTSETSASILEDLCDLLAWFTARRDCNLAELIERQARWRPAAGLVRPEAAAAMEGRPRTPVEDVVAAVWSDVLGAPPATMNQSLFEVGGHSLIATRLASRLREVFSISLPLKQVFEAPTVSALAKCIENELANGGSSTLPPVKPLAVRTVDVPLSYAQEPVWLVHKMLPGTVFYNFFAMVRLEGELHTSALARSFAAIIDRHEALRVRFVEVDGRPVQRIQQRVDFGLPLIDISALPDSERIDETAALASRESRRPFQLAGEPLLRACCLRIGAQEHLLCVTMHHVATDGWSSGILARELTQLYEAYSRGQEPALTPLILQQPDFAAWERERAAEGDFDSHLWYWLDQLDNGVRPLELPTDRARLQESFLVGREEYAVSGRLCGRLRELSRREGVSLFMTLLTSLQTVLSDLSGQSDYWMGTLVARRNQADLENPIGLFVNTGLLRCRVDPADSRGQALRRTRSAVFEAFEHQDLPFEMLMEELDGEPGIDKTRVCPVLFIMQNAPMEQLKLGALKVTPIESRSTGLPEVYPTSFEMIINVDEHPERLVVSVSYKTELFDKERIDRLASDWGGMLDAMAEELCPIPPQED